MPKRADRNKMMNVHCAELSWPGSLKDESARQIRAIKAGDGGRVENRFQNS